MIYIIYIIYIYIYIIYVYLYIEKSAPNSGVQQGGPSIHGSYGIVLDPRTSSWCPTECGKDRRPPGDGHCRGAEGGWIFINGLSYLDVALEVRITG